MSDEKTIEEIAEWAMGIISNAPDGAWASADSEWLTAAKGWIEAYGQYIKRERGLSWRARVEVVVNLLQWADTQSEIDPHGFSIVVRRNAGRGGAIAAEARWSSSHGPSTSTGHGQTAEEALIDLAIGLERWHRFSFPSLDRARADIKELWS